MPQVADLAGAAAALPPPPKKAAPRQTPIDISLSHNDLSWTNTNAGKRYTAPCGWYDAQGQGLPNDYGRWVGGEGLGGRTLAECLGWTKTKEEATAMMERCDCFWSVALAGAATQHTAPGEYEQPGSIDWVPAWQGDIPLAEWIRMGRPQLVRPPRMLPCNALSALLLSCRQSSRLCS